MAGTAVSAGALGRAGTAQQPEGFHRIPTLTSWDWVLKPPLLRVMHRDGRELRVEETFGIC